MLKNVIWILIIAFSLLCMPKASAQSSSMATGNDFYDRCKMNTDPSQQIFCLGYIQGLLKATEAAMFTYEIPMYMTEEERTEFLSPDRNAEGRYQYLKEMRKKYSSWCLPDRPTTQQLLDTFLSYLIANPEERHENITSLIHKAMSKSFPCRS